MTLGMLLMVDVGNTNTAFGLSLPESNDIIATWRLSSARDRTADEWFGLLDPLLRRSHSTAIRIDALIVSSVVPAITRAILELSHRYFDTAPMVVDAALDLGIRIDADNPSEVGSDRLVNCAYAFATFGGPTIIVDLGTGTKIEAIAADGAYLGGIIAPGLGLSLDALATRAARLYAVELQLPIRAIGTNTVAAVQSGVVTGHLAMIEGMVARVATELGDPNHVVLTGGYSHVVAGQACFTDYQPYLTLRGLQYLYARNLPNS